MLRRSIATITVVAVVMLVVLFIATTPATAGPLGILALLVLLYLTALGVLTFLFHGISRFLVRISSKRKRTINSLSFKHSYYYASVIALVPVMVIAMHSVGEVGIYETLLIGVFMVIAWVYVRNRTA